MVARGARLRLHRHVHLVGDQPEAQLVKLLEETEEPREPVEEQQEEGEEEQGEEREVQEQEVPALETGHLFCSWIGGRWSSMASCFTCSRAPEATHSGRASSSIPSMSTFR